MAEAATARPPTPPLNPVAATAIDGARRLGFAAIFLAPSLILFGVFIFYPLIKSVYLGFYETDPFGRTGSFVDIDQYQRVLTSEDFRHALRVTFLFSLYVVPTGMLLGLGLALLANQRLRGISIFRTIFSSTVATSVAVGAVMWLTLLNPNIGVLNYILEQLALPRVQWLTDPDWALLAVSLTTVWLNLGLTFIVTLAGLQAIPEHLYESAKIDGAGRWSTFWNVTLPMLSPTLLFVFVISTIFSFQSFGQIHMLTQGGPLDATTVIVYAIYRDGFVFQNWGVAATQAIALFVLVLALTSVQFRFLERRVFYG